MSAKTNQWHFLKVFFAGTAVCGLRATAAEPKDLNIVFIISDQHRRASSGCYGDTVRTVDGASPTPNIDRLAEEGVVFDRAYASSPLCAPCRASLMSSMQVHNHTALRHQCGGHEAGLSRFPGIQAGVPAMGEVFRAAGYRTAAIGKMHVFGEQEDGWDLGFDVRDMRFYTFMEKGGHYRFVDGTGDLYKRYRGIGSYADKTYCSIAPERYKDAPPDLKVKPNSFNAANLPSLVEREEDMFDSIVAKRSIQFMQDCVSRGQKFMIHIGFEKPHEPWLETERFRQMYNWKAFNLPETIDDWRNNGRAPYFGNYERTSGDDARRSMAGYYAGVSSVDDNVGKVLHALKEMGIADNTVIIYTSDHGEHLYTHGMRQKHNMYEHAVGVPLIISAPGLPRGTRTAELASTIDMTPTLCGLAGVPVPDCYEGISLVPAMQGGHLNRKAVYSEFYEPNAEAWNWKREKDRGGIGIVPNRMVRTDQYKYIYTHGCIDQLYETGKDPHELENLVLDKKYDRIFRQLRLACLDGWTLDEIPLLTASADMDGDNVMLTWELSSEASDYTVWRSGTGDPFDAEILADEIQANQFLDKTAVYGAAYTYWIVAHYPLSRTFTDDQGKKRYGDTPVLTDKFPRQLPASNRLTITVKHKPKAGAE